MFRNWLVVHRVYLSPALCCLMPFKTEAVNDDSLHTHYVRKEFIPFPPSWAQNKTENLSKSYFLVYFEICTKLPSLECLPINFTQFKPHNSEKTLNSIFGSSFAYDWALDFKPRGSWVQTFLDANYLSLLRIHSHINRLRPKCCHFEHKAEAISSFPAHQISSFFLISTNQNAELPRWGFWLVQNTKSWMAKLPCLESAVILILSVVDIDEWSSSP